MLVRVVPVLIPLLHRSEPGAGYTVQKFLEDVTDRYGGIDALLFWPTYTNIGIQ